jgi:hypothetical protein
MKSEQKLLRDLLTELYPPLAADEAELIGLTEADDLEPYEEPYERKFW